MTEVLGDIRLGDGSIQWEGDWITGILVRHPF